ncbi:TlpA family protein disulfide reductase [Flavobacterium agrisoli]|uniref:Redoxin domain-containing protein n=1 Tax=Flavobacterium agrisoli TaxID=2793066 RepID=A0A934PJC4_9FLAO|nr:TlpA family protein disulfide reductase [Flavobacterium agrisoli]MBK0369192.1 redoxin domain-containing protein [Flavobacterium agrisoli]
MMKPLFLVVFLTLFSSKIMAQEVAVFDNYANLEKAILSEKNTTYVVNFWATWCAPCVKELPYFEQLNLENKKVKVVLVSLDFKDQYEAKLIPFVKRKNLQSQVVLLTDKDYNNWLPMVNNEWSGAIPATLILHQNQKIFVEKSFENFSDLNEFVTKNIN